MADSFIQVAPDSTGKMMQTYLNTISGNPVHAEAVGLVDTSGNPITTLPVSIASNINIGSNVSVTGSVTANAGTNLNTSLLATSGKQSDGTQKTQICDPINVSNVAGVTSGALNVFLSTITANAGANLNTSNVAVKVFQGAASLASGQIIVGNISTTIAGARATRRSATIRNQDATNTGFIGPAPIGTGNGLLLYPGDSVSVDFVGVIAGISLNATNAGNVTFGYLETYD